MMAFGFKERPRHFLSDPRLRRGRHLLAPRDPSDPATLPTLLLIVAGCAGHIHEPAHPPARADHPDPCPGAPAQRHLRGRPPAGKSALPSSGVLEIRNSRSWRRWLGRRGSPTRALRPAIPGEISDARPTTPIYPGRQAQPGHL